MTGSWNKFTALTELLECSLTDISEWLPKYNFYLPLILVFHVINLPFLVGKSSFHLLVKSFLHLLKPFSKNQQDVKLYYHLFWNYQAN